MGRGTRRAAALTLLAAALAGAAGAEVADDPTTRTGFYAGLGATYAIEAFSYDSENLGMTAILGPGVNPAFDASAGVELQIGHRLHRHLGAELRYVFLEGFDSTRGSPGTEIDAHQFVLATKLYPLGGPIQPYALVGVGALLVNSEVRDRSVPKPFETDLDLALRLGGGVDLYATDRIVVALEASWIEGAGGLAQHADHVLLSLHYVWRF